MNHKETRKKEGSWMSKYPIVLFVGIAITIILFLIAYYHWIKSNFSVSEDQGMFGDMFGGANALFSGLAFAGVIIAIILQKEELASTRKEFEEQNETMKLQRFENTFFNLLKLHHENIQSQKDFNALSFKKLYSSFADHEMLTTQEKTDEEKINILESIRINYDFSLTHRSLSDLEEYFRILESILYVIVESEIRNKEVYIEILRTQLSNNELLLIFYHGLSPHSQNLKDLIEKTGLLKYMKKDELKKGYGPYMDQVLLYDPPAFDSQHSTIKP